MVQEGKLKRALEHRHLSMIALGGSIGTGLFVGSGQAIGMGGPLGVLAAYLIVGVLVFAVALGEMATQVPTSGAFGELTSRFVEPALGFALGWNYYFLWLLVVPAELAVFGSLFLYWLPDAQSWYFTIAGLFTLLLLNLVGVKVYGEVEYWLSFMKIVAITAFISVGIIVAFGGNSEGKFYGFENWKSENVEGAPFTSFIGFLSCFLMAFYSYGGTEIIGVTAGEAKNPSVSVPRAIKGTFWRILLFYVLSLFVIGLIIPFTDEILHKQTNAMTSPFTRMLEIAGLKIAPDIMNAVILIAVFSAANGSVYASTRTLQSLAVRGMAPRILVNTTSWGVPINAVLISFLFGSIALVGGLVGSDIVFSVLASVLSMATLAGWVVIIITHFRFRLGWRIQGRKDSELIYKAPFFPYIGIFGIMICGIVCGLILHSFSVKSWNFVDAAHITVGLPVIVFTYLGYKLYEFVYKVPNAGLVPYEKMNFDSGIQPSEDMEVENEGKKESAATYIF